MPDIPNLIVAARASRGMNIVSPEDFQALLELAEADPEVDEIRFCAGPYGSGFSTLKDSLTQARKRP